VTDVILRKAVLSDIEEIARIEEVSIAHPWSEDELRDLVESDRKTAIVACVDDKIAGYIGASFLLDEAEIGNICVTPGLRGKGIGKKLLKALIEEMKNHDVEKIFLEVESTNTAAINLYEGEGFESYNTRKDYYGLRRDAVLYRLFIKS